MNIGTNMVLLYFGLVILMICGFWFIWREIKGLYETVASVNGRMCDLSISVSEFKLEIYKRVNYNTKKLADKLDRLNRFDELDNYDKRFKYLLQRYPDISPDVIRFIMDMGGKNEKTNA